MLPRLLNAHHYHHTLSHDPRPGEIQEGQERIELVTGGRGWIYHQGDYQEVLPGDLLWQCQGDLTICKNDPDNPYNCLAMSFEVDPEIGRPVERVTRWEDKVAIKQFTHEVIQCFYDHQYDKQTLAQYAYTTLLFQAKRHLTKTFASSIPSQLQAFIQIVDQQYMTELRIDQIAKRIQWSEPYLYEQCNKYFNESPLQYILRHRINHAKDHLRFNSDSIKIIAAANGFNSSSHFCRSFKQHVGVSPKAYRYGNT